MFSPSPPFLSSSVWCPGHARRPQRLGGGGYRQNLDKIKTLVSVKVTKRTKKRTLGPRDVVVDVSWALFLFLSSGVVGWWWILLWWWLFVMKRLYVAMVVVVRSCVVVTGSVQVVQLENKNH
jgi:hypothetical protein